MAITVGLVRLWLICNI